MESQSLRFTPFPHEVGTWLPDDRYREILANLPGDKHYKQYASYQNRSLFNADSGFWGEVLKELTSPYEKASAQLCRDKPGYSIGPHTDGANKLRTFLFYLTDTESDCGTSLFVPKKAIKDDQHHGFDDFELVETIPYKPNTYLSFERTDKSFHGVLPCRIVRNVLQLSVYR